MQLIIATRATCMQAMGRYESTHADQHCYTSYIHASTGQIDKHACSSALLHEPQACKQWADRQACMQISIATRATYMQVLGRLPSMHADQHCYTSHIHASSGQIDKHACSSALLHEPHTCKQWADGQACMQLSIATRATYMQEVGR